MAGEHVENDGRWVWEVWTTGERENSREKCTFLGG